MRSPDKNLFLGYVLGEGTRAESILVPNVELFDKPLDDVKFKDVLILLPFPPVLSLIGLAIPFSSNGGYKKYETNYKQNDLYNCIKIGKKINFENIGFIRTVIDPFLLPS